MTRRNRARGAAACIGLTFCSLTVARAPGDCGTASPSNAFGQTEGRESFGLYNPYYVRGFSPMAAGNVRLNGLYFSPLTALSNHVIQSSNMEVGLSAMDDPFPAPTGIANYHSKSSCQQTPVSTVTLFAGPYETHGIDIDAAIRAASGSLFIPLGLTYQVGATLPGYTSQLQGIGVAPQWQPSDALSIQGFWDRHQSEHIRSLPIFLTAGDYLPPASATSVSRQPWAEADFRAETAGLTLAARMNPELSVAAGIFHAQQSSSASYSDLYLNIAPEGIADHWSVRDANRKSQITSGEIKLTWEHASKWGQHGLILSVRGRGTSSLFGDSDAVDLGQEALGTSMPIPAPLFESLPQTRQKTTSWTTGVAYRETSTRLGEISVGIQKADYRETVAPPEEQLLMSSESPWLLNLSARAKVTQRVTLFSGYTQGLEDSGIAPSTADNRGAILEAARTHQGEIGLRYAQSANTTLLFGAFRIAKPYINLDSANVYRPLGIQRAQGVEFSVATHVDDALHLTAGWVFNRIRVMAPGSAVALGPTAFGQPDSHGVAIADYRFKHASCVSVDLGVEYWSPVPASNDGAFELPARTTVDIGSRIRFTLLNRPTTLRIQAQNITGDAGWGVGLSPGFIQVPSRRYLAYLTVDI